MVEQQFDVAPDDSAERPTESPPSPPSDFQPSRAEPAEPDGQPTAAAPEPARVPDDYQAGPNPYYQPAAPPWQPQQRQPSPGLMPGDVGQQLDWSLLNDDYVRVKAETIRARFDAPYRAAATESERSLIRERYELEGQRLAQQIEQTKFQAERWQDDERRRQEQAEKIGELRQRAAETLAAEWKLSPAEVLRDEDGRELWDPHEMKRHARLMARIKHGERVTERQTSGVDRGYQPSGGSGPSTEDERWARMSDADFQQAWSRHRSGGTRSQV